MPASSRRPPGRPRVDQSPASLDDILGAALTAFATHGYDGVSIRTLNRELGVSHNLINARFGSKETLWYATVDWAFRPLTVRIATAFDPTLHDPLDQLRTVIRVFLMHSAEHPELLGLMNIEGRQDTKRLEHIYTEFIAPALAPVERLLEHLTVEQRARPISMRDFHFLIAHGAAAPFTVAPLARHFDPAEPLDPDAATAHADLMADLIIRALTLDSTEQHPRVD